MRTLTSGWSESSAAFQHDVNRSWIEGDFSPARGTHGPLLTHAWLHILLNTSTIYSTTFMQYHHSGSTAPAHCIQQTHARKPTESMKTKDL